MQLLDADREPEYDELPTSTVRIKALPLGQCNPLEAQHIAHRPQTIKPLPDDVSDAKRRQLAGLAQYRGRSIEGRRRAVENLSRGQKMSDRIERTDNQIVELPPEMPVPKVPTKNWAALLPNAKAMEGKALRLVMSKEEFDLYVEEWKKWYEGHAVDFTEVEDQQDVHHMCMETVIQFRINLAQQKNPAKDFSLPYNQSFLRQQKARENLAARRVDRVGSRANQKTTLNIAILAGQASQTERRKHAEIVQQKADDFLDATVKLAQEEQKAAEADEV